METERSDPDRLFRAFVRSGDPRALGEVYDLVAPELLRAFQASKELHLKRIAENGPRNSDDRHILENQKLIGGGDPLPFGLEANRPTFQALIDYAYDQKIIPQRIKPEDVLAPNALEL